MTYLLCLLLALCYYSAFFKGRGWAAGNDDPCFTCLDCCLLDQVELVEEEGSQPFCGIS